jgi:hypothetical protein
MLEVPEPSPIEPTAGAGVPKLLLHVPGFVVSYRNQPVALAPMGFPEPFNVAVVDVMLLAAKVVAVGGPEVVKDCTPPKAVPSLLFTIAQ